MDLMPGNQALRPKASVPDLIHAAGFGAGIRRHAARFELKRSRYIQRYRLQGPINAGRWVNKNVTRTALLIS
jgi:hypothetical protein